GIADSPAQTQTGRRASTGTTEITFNTKCAQSGVLGCWGFDDQSTLKYAWDTSDTALNSEMLRRGQTHFYISPSRLAGEGNTTAVSHPGGALTIPVIDKTIYSSGTGSLQFQIPSRSAADPGAFSDNFNKILGNPSLYISPNSPQGNVYYMQFKLRLNDVMVNTTFREVGATYFGYLSTSRANSTILTTDPAVPFDPAFVGR